MFFFNFVIFFNSENSSTYFKASCISLQKILIDEMSLSDCITLLTAFAQMESTSESVFVF